MMKLITLHLPPKTIKLLDMLVAQKKFPNRSEAIRFAIRDFLVEEFKDNNFKVENRIVPQSRWLLDKIDRFKEDPVWGKHSNIAKKSEG